MHVLVVDDQRSARRNLATLLEAFPDVTVTQAASLDEARRALEREPVDLALIDVRLSEDARNRDGLVLVKEVAEKTTAVPVCVTATSEMDAIRTAMRSGAYDYLLKEDLCEETLSPLINGLRERRRLEREVLELRARVSADAAPPGLIGTSAAMERLRGMIRRVAVSDRPVLVLGPTGSGKEVVTRAIHTLGPHPSAPLIDLNCGALPENLVESQLFGHEKGAFTGADRRVAGYFADVGKGTLFLDEIGELPLALQAKLLRVLESGRYRPVGTTAESVFEGRIVAATHADLEERARRGTFREDLLYRLNVLTVRVPPLDEHREDIPALVAHFLKKQRRPMRITREALDALAAQAWPGNIRQLRNIIDRLVVFAEEAEIDVATLREVTGAAEVGVDEALRRVARVVLQLPSGNKLDAVEEALVAEAMLRAEGNKSGAARLLGVHRKVIERRLEKRPTSEPPEPDEEA
ncbi:MAG: sigma-54 dependent transcriptional regulator [Deltaproteobacteria bacterium]|nr:sigma-54 dependent transcriptional regulator [Myxococcales bacterium]MDP3217197.1 sigma-54 dependent transcriptional regulator [Deltaproteobacteria bacterium]